jgi:hypothetical protein
MIFLTVPFFFLLFLYDRLKTALDVLAERRGSSDHRA